MGAITSTMYGAVNTAQNAICYEDKTENKYKKYGWRPQLPDHRDYYHLFDKSKNENVNCVDLRDKCPPIYDQGQLGSCTANGIGFVFEFDMMKQHLKPFIPSRLFLYYNERDMEGTTGYDAGANIRDGIKSLNKQGICPETEWPYDISKFTDKPPEICYTDAKKNVSVKYKKVVQNTEQFKAALIEGFPVVFGFSVFQSFESEQVVKTGIIPMPKPDEEQIGGHCVAIVGFIEDKKQFIVRNSWGKNWGELGYCYFPYEYLDSPDLASDFWIVQQVEHDNVEYQY